MTSSFLFVYGTLRRSSTHPMALFLRSHSRYLSDGELPGRLYNLGAYPAMVYDAAAESAVMGEIYELTDPAMVLRYLDEYEGIEGLPDDEYVRQLLPVQTPKGQIGCWVYIFNL